MTYSCRVKPDYSILSPIALEQLCIVFQANAGKHDNGATPRFAHAGSRREIATKIIRHTLQYLSGQDIDEESQCHHVTCAFAQAHKLCHLINTGQGDDDRHQWWGGESNA